MKVILSRKGWDTTIKDGKEINGGSASPIIGDTMLSLPIPDEDDSQYCSYDDISYNGFSYWDIIKGLRHEREDKYFNEILHANSGRGCHLDPDIRRGIRDEPDGWQPAFGQIGIPARHLDKQGVKAGDLFLFFGLFEWAKLNNGSFSYDKQSETEKGIHAIFGYMQIGEIVKEQKRITEEFHWHPHGRDDRFKPKQKRKERYNRVYTPSETLQLGDERIDALKLPGSGCFKFDEKLRLTMHKDKLKSTDNNKVTMTMWDYEKLPDVFKTKRDNPDAVDFEMSFHKSKNYGEDFFSGGVRQGQEFVMAEDDSVNEWVRDLFLHLNDNNRIERWD